MNAVGDVWVGRNRLAISAAEGIFHPYYLIMLAPLVMAYLGRQKRQSGAGANEIGSQLQAQRQQVEQQSPQLGGVLGQIFGGGGQDRPGIADDLARMAPNVLGNLFGGGR